MTKRARIIYNPTAGRETLRQKLVDIISVYEQAGYETSIFATTAEKNSALNEAKRVSENGFELVVAAGGDGTINEIINGIAPLKNRPELAILPAGTTNDFARALKIPRDDLVEAAKVVLKNNVLKMDIGKTTNDNSVKYFMNIAAGGSMTKLTYDVPSDLKTIFGYLAYLVKGAELLPQLRPVEMNLKFDDGQYNGKASMFFVAMTNSIAGFEQIVPDAELDDGKFTMIIVKTGNLVEILQLITKVLNGGRHVNDPRIIYKKTNTLEVSSEGKPLQINIDGEYGGDAPMTFVNLKQHLGIFSNLDHDNKKISDEKNEEFEKVKEELAEKVNELPKK